MSGMGLDDAFGLTIPQLEWALSTLSEVKRMEGGEGSSTDGNTKAAEGTYALLRKVTGRKTFTMEELEDPSGTIKRHKENSP